MTLYSGFAIIFKELQVRILWLFLCFALTCACCYTFSEEMVFLMAKPFLSIDKLNSYFISTQLTEILNTYITSSLTLCMFFCTPNVLYQLWCFFIPSCNQSQRARLWFVGASSLLAFYCMILITLFWILPIIWSFLCQFHTASPNLLRVQLQPKIYDFTMLTFRLLFLFGICSQIPMIFFYLLEYNWISSKNCIQHRSTLWFCSVLLAAIIAPPDIWCQLAIVFTMWIAIELILLYSIIRAHYTEMRHLAMPNMGSPSLPHKG